MELERNVILAGLAANLRRALAPVSSRMTMRQGDVLLEQGEPLKEVFFPLSGVVSIVTLLVDGGSVENAVVGREGFIGIPLVLGADRLPAQAVCQVDGAAVRIEASEFLERYSADRDLQGLLARYIHARLAMVMQTVACNRMHVVEQRCARWLLQARDRAGTDELDLTQEFLADMLGVRRASVTEVAQRLQREGSIVYRRGRVRVADAEKLRARTCECYNVINEEYARVLSMPPDFVRV